MIQRLNTLLILCCLSFCSVAAETASPPPQVPAKPPKTLEDRYRDGQDCLKKSDVACARVELAGMSPTAPQTKILEAQIAASQEDYDRVLQLLIPLQSNSTLPPQVSASLHATLAQAYENQGNPLHALEQFILSADAPSESLQQHILQLLISQPRASLLELRGESQDTLAQGWIDLALAANAPDAATALAQWRNAYPGHPILPELLQQLSQSTAEASADETLNGKVALLLPLDEPSFATAAAAVQAGIAAARGKSDAIVKVYPTTGRKEGIAAIYQQALGDGAQYVIGPLTREETTALAASSLKLAPTLALNMADQEKLPEHLSTFGLPVETEATQVARIARARGMQSAIIVSADTPLAKRMEQAFLKEWLAQDATLVLQATVSSEAGLAELKARLAENPADMIFLAADAGQARQMRPYLPQAIPTFGVSHVYDGLARNPENEALSAIHFVDMPWMLNPDHPDFAAYRKAAEKLPPGQAQRWFAVGVDAWHILATQSAGKPLLLHGLSGSLHMEDNSLVRELPMGQFRPEGVELE